MKLEYARLERDALLITKVAEDAKQQAEAYKKAYKAQALLCKQQEEQLQVIRSVAEAKVNAERDARVATERLAAQQVLASTHPRPTIIATPKVAQETSNSKKIKIFQIAAKYNL